MKSPNDVYQCECGNTGLWLYRNGRVHCPHCETDFTDMTVALPDGIPGPEETADATE